MSEKVTEKSTAQPAVKVVPVRLPEELHAELSAAAKEKGKSLTVTAMECIDLALRGSPIEAAPPPLVLTPPEPPKPEFPVDEFGVRIPQTTPGVDNKGICQRCHMLKTPLEPVKFGRLPKNRRYSWWCRTCRTIYGREIGK